MDSKIKNDLDFCVENNTKDMFSGPLIIREECDLVISFKNGLFAYKTNEKGLPLIRHRLNFFIPHFIRLAQQNKHWDFSYILHCGDGNGYLCVSVGKDHKNFKKYMPIPIPLWNYKLLSDLAQDPPLEEKIKKIIFAGITTGGSKKRCTEMNLINQRVDFCNWAIKYPNEILIYIILHHWAPSDLLCKSYKGKLSIQEQLKYKYLLNIDGNGTAWNRLFWQMASNSVCLFLKQNRKKMEWYYPLFEKKDIPLPFLWVTKEDILEQKMELDSNENKCKEIVENGKQFVKNYLCMESMDYYVSRIFDILNARYQNSSCFF